MLGRFGQAPTSDWIGNTLRLMLVDDYFSLTLQGGRSSVDQALNEVLWKDTCARVRSGTWAPTGRTCPSGTATTPVRWERRRSPRTIARTAVEFLLDRIPDIGPAVPADMLRWKETPIMRGLESLPVTFTPAVTR